MSAVKVFPDGKNSSILRIFNPGIPIPPEATAIHGFSDLEVAEKPRFESEALELYDFFKNCDLGGFNIANFDFPLLAEEFHRASFIPPFDKDTKILDAMKIYHHFEKRDLTAAYKFYCGKLLENAHSASADVTASIEILNNQMTRHGFMGDVGELSCFAGQGERIDFAGKFARNGTGEIVLTFGKHEGIPAATVPDYLTWMLTADFPSCTKLIAQKIKNGELH